MEQNEQKWGHRMDLQQAADFVLLSLVLQMTTSTLAQRLCGRDIFRADST